MPWLSIGPEETTSLEGHCESLLYQAWALVNTRVSNKFPVNFDNEDVLL